jgi:hypothetical protein
MPLATRPANLSEMLHIDSIAFCSKISVVKLELAMGSTMPLSTYTCEPGHMEAMRAAFYRVCDVLQLSCDREDQLTEVVVAKIVELTKTGERDPEKLCFTVLAELEMPLQEAIPRSSPKPTSVVSTEPAGVSTAPGLPS